MPILAEKKHLYPDNWGEISNAVVQRAGYKCEECGVENYALGGRYQGTFCYARPKGERMASLEWPEPGEWWWCGGCDEKLKIFRIVLTVAHLDHDPTNREPENLKAMCQKCHLNYDARFHAETRRKRKAAGDLFE